MNQGRMWTVVKPTVGIPVFLGAVAVTSLLVHYAILSHTSWYPAFLEGGKKKVSMEIETTVPAGLALKGVEILNS
jgi:light-harvesting protein B-800-850 alpha chain